MADQPETTAVEAPAPKSGRGRMTTIIAVVLLMGVEGAGIFYLTSALSGTPASSEASDGAEGGDGNMVVDDLVEVSLVECRPTSGRSGKLITLHIAVSGLAAASRKEDAVIAVEAHRARLEDRVNFVIRSAEPKHLNEPGLETIRRRLKYEFDRIFNDSDLIQEVLITKLLQSG